MSNSIAFVTAVLIGATLGFAWGWRTANVQSMGTETGYQLLPAIFGSAIGGTASAISAAIWIVLMTLHP
jgi:hypothetical protein